MLRGPAATAAIWIAFALIARSVGSIFCCSVQVVSLSDIGVQEL